MRFERGRIYFATHCADASRKRLVQVVGRRGGVVLFSAVQALETKRVEWFDGREVAQLEGADGPYVASAAVAVDADLAIDILAASPAHVPEVAKTARRGIFSKFANRRKQ